MIIYLFMFCPFYLPIPIFVKVGSAQYDWIERLESLNEEVRKKCAIPGCFIPLCVVYVPFAFYFEQKFHKMFSFAQTPFYKGSGKTETYPSPVGAVAIALMLPVWAGYCWGAGRVFGFDGVEWFGFFLLSVGRIFATG